MNNIVLGKEKEKNYISDILKENIKKERHKTIKEKKTHRQTK